MLRRKLVYLHSAGFSKSCAVPVHLLALVAGIYFEYERNIFGRSSARARRDCRIFQALLLTFRQLTVIVDALVPIEALFCTGIQVNRPPFCRDDTQISRRIRSGGAR